MKYTALALLGAASANKQTDKVFVQDEMHSLLKIIRSVETTDASAVLDVIETRKEQLQLLVDSHPERASHIVGELHNLLAVTKTLEDKDMNGALNELEVRKDELTQKAQDIMMMGDEVEKTEEKTDEKKTEEKTDEKKTDAKDEKKTDAKDAEKKDETPAEVKKTDEDKAADAAKVKADEKAVEAAKEVETKAKEAADAAPKDEKLKKASEEATKVEKAAEKTLEDDKAEAKKETKVEESGSKAPIIIGVIGAVILVGVGIHCYRKKNAEEEGGVKEDRKMFKAVIKNKSTQKQNLV
jgi:cobalamin biosynthesis Mg chelatase CobN